MEKTSIILTTWAMSPERSETMRRCIESVIATTKHLPVEIIIVDNGGSLDDSTYLLNLCNEKRIHHYVRNSENLYFGWGRNIGVHISSGDYLVFSDNDIEYKQGWLEECISVLEQNPEKKILMTPLRTDREHRNERHWMGKAQANGKEYLLNMRAGSNSWVMRRKDFFEIGWFRNHYVAGSKWNDAFVRAGYLMATMEKDSLAVDIGFKRGYNHTMNATIKKVFANGTELIINS